MAPNVATRASTELAAENRRDFLSAAAAAAGMAAFAQPAFADREFAGVGFVGRIQRRRR